MKRIIAIILVLLMFVGMLPADAAGSGKPNVKQATAKAGEFKGVTHKLKSGVEMLKASDFKKVKAKIESGKIQESDLPSSVKSKFSITKDAISEKKIFVSDDWSETITIEQTAKEADQGRLLIGDPNFLDVFEDIDIPEQTVYLTPGNLAPLEKGMSVTPRTISSAASSQSTNSNTNASSSPNTLPKPPSTGGATTTTEVTPYGFSFKFTDASFTKKVGGVDIIVRINGLLDLEAPHVEGKYKKFDGYRLVLTAGETINLNVKSNIDLKEDIKIPIGTPFIIPAGVGKASVGLFIVLRVDGSIMLSFDLNQHFSVTAGVKGGTWFYIPTSISKVFDCKKEFNTVATFNGEVKGVLGVAPILSLKFAGMNALYLEVLLGVKAHIKITGDDRDVNAGVNFKVSGEVLNQNFTLVNYYLELYNYKERNTGKFKIKIDNACAYRELVEGTVEYPDKNGDYKPFNGKLSIRVTDNKGKKVEFDNISITNGKFTSKTVLKSGYKVEAKAMGYNVAYCAPVDVSFPFDRVTVDAADYFNKIIEGNISTKAVNVKGAANDAITEMTYNGPVKLTIRNDGRYYHKTVNVVNGKFKVNTANGAEFVKELNPDSLVNVSIEKNGFEIHDQMVETDGLIFYPFVYAIEKNGKGNAGNMPVTYTSKGMKFYVANQRAEEYPNNTPSGVIEMRMAVEFPHIKAGIPLDITAETTHVDEGVLENESAYAKEAYNRIYLICRDMPLEKVAGKKGIAVAIMENVSLEIAGKGNSGSLGTGSNGGALDANAAIDSSFITGTLDEFEIFEMPESLFVVDNYSDYFEKYDLTHYFYSYTYAPYMIYKSPSSSYPFSFTMHFNECLLENIEKDTIGDEFDNTDKDIDLDLNIGEKIVNTQQT